MVDIEAKIATLLDEYRVALNRGSDDGVTEGADVILWRLVNVKDPDTGEVLDTVRLDTLQLKVVAVKSRVSVAQVPAQTSLSIWGLGAPRPRLATEGGSGSTKQVRVKVGDEVTVRVRERTEPS